MFASFIGFICMLLLAIACVFVVGGAVGLLRLPDFYTRLHATSVTDTGGAIFVSIALFLQAVFIYADPLIAIKVTLILFFTLFTAPTASHALAKTALLSGHVPLGADGKPLFATPGEAARLARSRPVADDDPQFGPRRAVDGRAAEDGDEPESP